MKNIFALTFFFLCFFSKNLYAQNKLKALKIENYDSLLYKMNNPIRNDIYSLNEDELKKIIQQSRKPKTLIYTFGWWCGACVKKLPEILKIKKTI